jgi:MFS family permease
VPGRRIFLDLRPLREGRDFRLLFAGQLAGVFAAQLAVVAVAYEVYGLTGSSFQVGAVSLAQLVPLVIGAFAGGALADAFDRRRILVVASALMAVTAGALTANAALSHPSVAAIYVVSALAAGLGGVVSSVGHAAVPALVPAGRLVAAYATMQVVDQSAMVVAPAVSGLLISGLGLAWLFALVVLAYLLAAASALRMSPVGRSESRGRRRPASIVEGVRYLKGRQALQGAYLIDLNAMVFGMPRAVFPALATSVFQGGAGTLGFLYAAPGAGALLGAITTGWLERVRRQAWAVIVAVGVWGAAVAAFGFVHVLAVALTLLAVAGWADVVSAVLRSAILQSSVPEAMRGRIASLQIAVVEGGPRLGDLESGAVATAVSTQFSIVSGGLACVAGAVVLAAALPGFRHFRRGSRSGPEPAG